jgi:hypothetical protein
VEDVVNCVEFAHGVERDGGCARLVDCKGSSQSPASERGDVKLW